MDIILRFCLRGAKYGTNRFIGHDTAADDYESLAEMLEDDGGGGAAHWK